jgi:hypothetical protein
MEPRPASFPITSGYLPAASGTAGKMIVTETGWNFVKIVWNQPGILMEIRKRKSR